MTKDTEAPRGSYARRLGALLAAAFVVTLAIIVGTRLSSDAIAVLVGVIAGVGASIPTALLLLAVTRRREQEEDDEERYEEPRQAPPPVIVVTPGGISQQQLPYQPAYPYAIPAPAPRRQFRVMGYDADEDQPAEEETEQNAWKW